MSNQNMIKKAFKMERELPYPTIRVVPEFTTEKKDSPFIFKDLGYAEEAFFPPQLFIY